MEYGAARCGHLTVTQEKQVGWNPIYSARTLFDIVGKKYLKILP